MKVDRNQQLQRITAFDENGRVVPNGGGIPIRLAIAAQILTGWNANPEFHYGRGDEALALEIADRLIEAHNDTCGDT